MPMRTRVAIAAVLFTAAAAAGGGAWLALREPDEWPPAWYVERARDRDEYGALRRRAIATVGPRFEPSKATLAYLRTLAVGTGAGPGERTTEARVYVGGGYVLALRGRFSTSGIPRPHGARIRPFVPCVMVILDPTLFEVGARVATHGKCDFFPRGPSINLDLYEEPR